MQYFVDTADQYMDAIPEDRKAPMMKLRKAITDNLPQGFSEGVSYGMLGWAVPHSLYPAGYHCDPKQALPFLAIASQKSFIAFYHMGIYADKELHDWFVAEFPKHSKYKLDMGKSCIRFKKPDAIPFELIAELVGKMTPQQWIELYEKNLKR
ncbi:DUF1801 domain-containing protein [Flavobacterium sp. AG291]|uniref:DUF1801 domain-containing protein n=1 Tax=Flavobacterium sp. AG291 TaxID=2184000 RepID=UPI000E0A5A02|nr:DUF1801 domain-containing protein [Flavobacterium sp. AG291]RDI13364.1 uncharacterized protein DUF1801 [Flavobacterium sp. AG291]